MRKIVYTVLSGGYDTLHPVLNKNDEIDYIVVSDEEINVPDGWTLLKVEREKDESSILFNRKYKIKPQLIFSEYDASIYIDSNISVVGDVDYLFNKLFDSLELMLAYDHPVRSKLYEEANELKYQGFDLFYRINKQVEFYYKDGYFDNGFYEANILVRNHSDELYLIMDTWYQLFMNGVKRDQISLMFSFWSNNKNIKSLGTHDARFINDTFLYNKHIKKYPLRRKINKFINLFALNIGLDSRINYD
ncbi:hypothetical protein VT25_03890 [Photobacterium leiognathi subsp. mandapamensis]|nr:hypothetical protein VT25_03890 [Photobacterium leiognathi subsp. mandapamensis]